jgi:hypothetical protein
MSVSEHNYESFPHFRVGPLLLNRLCQRLRPPQRSSNRVADSGKWVSKNPRPPELQSQTKFEEIHREGY